jgi:hypothetical protein
MVAAAFRSIFAQATPVDVEHRWAEVEALFITNGFTKAAESMAGARTDVLAFTATVLPRGHSRKIWSTGQPSCAVSPTPPGTQP